MLQFSLVITPTANTVWHINSILLAEEVIIMRQEVNSLVLKVRMRLALRRRAISL